ncbi:TPA: hypothetical protein QCN48_005086 [Bacillus toyonensis]|nr:hypothetical protein [Bacillus toyonensis]
MNPTEFTTSQLKDIWRENDERFELEHEGDWDDQGKFSSQEVVFKDTETGKFYAFDVWRSGSYFSHYEYEIHDNAYEVKKEIKKIEVERWVAV